MICALAELQALVLKATVGAGMPWGIAEETARAARWLLAHDLPGLEALLTLLEDQPNRPYQDFTPQLDSSPWQARGGILCPLLSGITISDHATQTVANGKLELAATSFPVILIPFVSQAATATAQPLKLSWPEVDIICTAQGVYTAAASQQLISENVGCVRLSGVGSIDQYSELSLRVAGRHSVELDTAVWMRFEHLAQRTYVPASDASRQSGAGSGSETDND